MKNRLLTLVALTGAVFAAGCDPSVQKPLDVNARHQPKQIMGRDYWTFLGSGPYTDPGFADVGVKWDHGWNNSALTNLPVFRDCGVVRSTGKLPPPSAGKSSSWRTVKENCGDTQWKLIEADAKKDRPTALVFSGKRHVDAMAGDIELDYGDWSAFKEARPNLIGTRTMCEWGNDQLLLMRRTGNIVNPERRKELESVWARYSLTNRYDRLSMCRWYTDRKLKLHYNDMDTFMAFRGMFFLDHIAAAWGAKTLTAETTNTSSGDTEYRWDVSGMFVRGAARQFGLPWCWYEANYFNGPGKDGEIKNNSVCSYRYLRGNARPEGGTSASAQRRCWYYAYLNGANAVEPESWSGQFFTTNTFSGKAELSGRGKNFRDFHDFTSAHPDRGVTYAPVAILTPFAQGYTAHGGQAWGSCGYADGDYALDALFFTIAPGWERAKGLKAGIQEGNLHNSRFAMMYDVLVPDSPQPKEDFAKALFAYPAAILVGDYPDASKFEDVLQAYERAGGKLVRLNAGELPKRTSSTLADIRAGRMKFPSVERTLEKLQRELFPFVVKGDCQYGANKTEKGWWLWVFNNKGVRKYADTFETIDHADDSEVTVEFSNTSVAPTVELMSGRKIDIAGRKFTFTVPAGDFVVFEIGEGAEFAVARGEFSKYYAGVTGTPAPKNIVEFAIDPAISKTGKDAYSIVSAGKGVKITGSNMRSVMYGVYDLFERRGGCRWFWDGDVVPRLGKVDLSNLDVHEEAQFEWRGLRYFAHRGLTRFQAEHWGFDDWKKEIDWCLKRRLNVFMMRIGQDDLFQLTFPETCAYPDPAKPLPGAGRGYDNRSLFWSLKFRGDLRRKLQRYAFARGMEVPEDFGTMTHWYSRTPEDFLAKRKPPFLPQATRGYKEPNGLVWDIRDEKWADEYWKLTQKAVDSYGKPGLGLLHTIGLGERLCYTNRADNLKLKIEALHKFLKRAERDFPEKKVILGGWDFYFTWYPEEVKELVKSLDPKRVIIWDYEGDATRDYRPEMKKVGGNDFTKWGVVGKFPYTYSIFLAFEDAIDIRANYPLIEKRQQIVQNDPACAGYVFWPESSHTDTLCLRFFTANAWSKKPVPIADVLDEFCASRYGDKSKLMKSIWQDVLPISMLRDWRETYGRVVTLGGEDLPKADLNMLKSWNGKLSAAGSVFRRLAEIPWRDEFIRRDTIDLARTTLDRVLCHRVYELSRDVETWRNGGEAAGDLAARAGTFTHLMELMADVLALHTDYSLWESYLRLDAVEKIQNPEFSKVLFDNASCGYCRSHQYELARHWYVPRMRKAMNRLLRAVAAGERKVKLCANPDDERDALMKRPLESLKPTLPRTEKHYRAVMLAIADVLDGKVKVRMEVKVRREENGNLLRNSQFKSADGIVPDGWEAARGEKFQGAFTCTGGVLRISACAPAYCHKVVQTMAIDGTKSHWFEADVKCDPLMYYANVRYSLLDAKGREVVAQRPLFHPHYAGPQKNWVRVGLPIPAQETERVRKLQLIFAVYNNSRKPTEDRALYIRNPSVSVYSGQQHRPLPAAGSRAGGGLPAKPFVKLPADSLGYRLEKGGVGHLNLSSPYAPRGKASELKVEAPPGVTYELHLRKVGELHRLFRHQESGNGVFKLPKSVNWPLWGTLLFVADDTVPPEFKFRLTFTIGGESRTMEVPVKIIDSPAVGEMPKKRRYLSWTDRPLFGIDKENSPLGKALAEYWLSTGWEPSSYANITDLLPYRYNPKRPVARQGVGVHGTPTGIFCDSDLQAKGAQYYRDMFKSSWMSGKIKESGIVIWDYEPYVVGPVTIGCFCEDCRRAFTKEIGASGLLSGEQILKSHEKEWVHFRCRQRAASVKVVVEGLKLFVPEVKFGLCTMPMAPGAGDAGYADDYSYLLRYGIDLPLFEDFTDSFCSMNYTRFLTFFRSMEREVNEIKKPKHTLIENGWGNEPRQGKLLALQLVAAFFAGLDRPYIAAGIGLADGDQLSEIRRAMQFIAETEGDWENGRFCRDKYSCTVVKGDVSRFWSMDREMSDGTRFVLLLNCSRTEAASISVKSPSGAVQAADLPPYSWKLLRFNRK